MVAIQQGDGLLERLSKYDPGQTNMSAEILADHATGWTGKAHTFFFIPEDAEVFIPIGGNADLVIPLCYADYQQESGRVYDIHPEMIDWIPGNADRLQGRLTLSGLMDALDAVVNQTMRYDTDKLITIIFNDIKKQDANHAAQRQKKPKTDDELREMVNYMIGPKRSQYVPRGDETWAGVCTDAGARWGEIMLTLDLPGVVFTDVPIRADMYGPPHDTRVAVEVATGNWVVWNCKDPEYDFSNPTREQLQKFGEPYVPRSS
ncbi:hypothetical protein KY362_00335 [Candidatus Woesearchaeota archaeon]|nr:hypothetical protein [Candidatus Woesearchaeota archaeon]